VSRFWLTYLQAIPAASFFGVLILDSPSLIGARMRAAVEGIDQAAEFAGRPRARPGAGARNSDRP